ncbi:MAG: hypothetical protein ACJ8GN_26395 [Longimicrobiaceae bacterium]
MPRQNRVTPRGELVAVDARGTFMGNRGCLHDAAGRIRRAWQLKRWIVCELEFKGRHRPVMQPGCYTELFFLDEATALAAGHRPCAECRRPAFRAFLAAWAAGGPGGLPSAPALDEVLHRERTSPPWRAPLGTLPDGAFVALPGDPRPFLVLGDALLAWTPGGYTDRRARPSATVEVLTPRSTVEALRAGYRPVLHSSAG